VSFPPLVAHFGVDIVGLSCLGVLGVPFQVVRTLLYFLHPVICS
jgi:hypothetical protein